MKPNLQPNPIIRIFVYTNVLFWGGSVSAGGLTIGLNVVMVALALLLMMFSRVRIPKLTALILGLAALLAGFITFFAGPCNSGLGKVIFSVSLMACMLLALTMCSGYVSNSAPLVGVRDVRAMLFLITFAAAAQYAYKLASGVSPAILRVGGIFLEPSHLALSAAPLVCCLWFSTAGRDRLIAVAMTAVLLVTSWSSTLLVLLALLIAIPYMGNWLKNPWAPGRLVSIAGVAGLVVLIMQLPGFADVLLRFNDVVAVSPEANISSLVYVNGWQMLAANLEATQGWGLGFNAMGCEPRQYTEIDIWLSSMDLHDQNFNDGSFILSKLGSELGYAGIVLLLLGLAVSLRALFRLGTSDAPVSARIAVAWMVVLTAGGLVRSSGGYFTGPCLLGLFGLVLMVNGRLAQLQHGRPAPLGTGATPPLEGGTHG